MSIGCPSERTDITEIILTKRSTDCGDYIGRFQATTKDEKVGKDEIVQLDILAPDIKGPCVFLTDGMPNHVYNDDPSRDFPNTVTNQEMKKFTIERNPVYPGPPTLKTLHDLSLNAYDGIFLNGALLDLLANACAERNLAGNWVKKFQNCGPDAEWRLDPVHPGNGMLLDSHHAHAQPSDVDGAYHYHSDPNALYKRNYKTIVTPVPGPDDPTGEPGTESIVVEDPIDPSPVIGFAADGFPIFGPYIRKDGVVRKVVSSYQLKKRATGSALSRPTGVGGPGGECNGEYLWDYVYKEGTGDLDRCNGMVHNGKYAYYITDGYPYILNCFTGDPDSSFIKD
jgi:hypothetical protein